MLYFGCINKTFFLRNLQMSQIS